MNIQWNLLWVIGSCDYGGWRIQICSAVWKPRHPGDMMMQFQSEGSLLQNFLLLREAGLLLYSGLQLIRWDPLTLWKAIWKFTNLNVNLIQKHPPSWYIKLTITLGKYSMSSNLNYNQKSTWKTVMRKCICSTPKDCIIWLKYTSFLISIFYMNNSCETESLVIKSWYFSEGLLFFISIKG